MFKLENNHPKQRRLNVVTFIEKANLFNYIKKIRYHIADLLNFNILIT